MSQAERSFLVCMVSCNGLCDGFDMSNVLETEIDINFDVDPNTIMCGIPLVSDVWLQLNVHVFLPYAEPFSSGIKDVCISGGSEPSAFRTEQSTLRSRG